MACVFYHNFKKRRLQRERPFELNSNMDNYNKLTEMGNDSFKLKEYRGERELERCRTVTDQQLVEGGSYSNESNNEARNVDLSPWWTYICLNNTSSQI